MAGSARDIRGLGHDPHGPVASHADSAGSQTLDAARPPRLSVVVPAHDEEALLEELARRLAAVLDGLGGDWEVILVDDGSTDRTFWVMSELHRRDGRFKVLRLTRNFGHQLAITAGLDVAGGDAVVVMDADLQHPPEVIPKLVESWREGHDIVYAVMRSRAGETAFKRVTARVFYRVLGRLSDVPMTPGAGDFRLLGRRAADALRSLKETNRYVRGMVSWIGLSQASVDYDAPARTAGRSKYSLARMVKLATDGVLSFSSAPLRSVLRIGFATSFLAFFVGAAAAVAKLADAYTVPGWASITVVISFFAGIQLVVLGVVGEYVARIYDEVRDRPLYLVDRVVGIEDDALPRRPNVLAGAERSDA